MIVGIAVWAIAFVVLLPLHAGMARHGQGWWLWVALTGFLLGFWGLTLIALRRRGLRRAAASARATEQGTRGDAPPPGNRPA